MRLPVQGIPAPSCLRTSWWWWLVGFFHLLLCSTAPGKRLPPATGAASHLQLTSDFGLPSALLPFPLGAARPAARRDMQSLLGYTLAPWRLEAVFFLFWGENWGRNKQRSYVGNGLSFQQGPTITHSCGRTEAVHLPEMRERTAVMLAVSSGCEQRKRTFYLLQFPARLFPYSTTRYYQDTGARCPKSLQEAKNRCHLYFGRTQGVLPVHFAEISPPPGTPWPPIHPTTPCATAGCRNNRMHWSDSAWWRRGKRRREGTFSFYHQGCGTLDTTASGMNHQYPSHRITLQQLPLPLGFAGCWQDRKDTKTEVTSGSFGDKTSPWVWEAMGIRTFCVTNHWELGWWSDTGRPRAVTAVAMNLLLSTDLIKSHSYHPKIFPYHQRWRLCWILGPQYVSCGWLHCKLKC